MKPPHRPPLLYLITNRQVFRRNTDTEQEACRAQLEAIRLAAQHGVQLIQIREKDLSARALAEFTRQAIAVARPQGAAVLVNDRLDVALATNADGVHLRTTSLPATDVRAITTAKGLNDFLIGVSTHTLAEAKMAEAGDADFIVCGPVYETPSKCEFGPPLGLERFAEICSAVNLPVMALGGINLSNFREPLERGAKGLAAITLFTEPDLVRQIVAISDSITSE